MFNLLRRSKHKKSKNKYQEEEQQQQDHSSNLNANTNRNAASVAKKENQAAATSYFSVRGATEHYRRLNDAESDSLLPIASGEGKSATQSGIRKPNIRATIAELDDLGDLDTDTDIDIENDDHHHDDRDVNNVVGDRGATMKCGKDAHVDYLYSERRQPKCENHEKKYSVEHKEKQLNFAKVAHPLHSDGRNGSNAHRSGGKSTTAIKSENNNNNVLAFSKVNIDRIYNLAAVATHGIAATYNKNNVDNDADADNEVVAVPIDGEHVAKNRDLTSQYEEAEWQGHVLPIGSEFKISDNFVNDIHSIIELGATNKSKGTTNSNQSIDYINTITTKPRITTAYCAEDAERFKVTAKGRETIGNINKSNNINTNNENNTCSSQCDTVTVATTATDKLINEQVKYRQNLDKDKRNTETKRQSRLSLTFSGLNLLSNNSNTSNKSSTIKDTGKSTEPPLLTRRLSSFFHSYHGSSSRTKPNSSSRLTDKETTRCSNEDKRPNSKLFFISKSEKQKPKANVTEEIAKLAIDQSKRLEHNRKVENFEVDKKLRPLQKSKEFFSDIFMARGRNHNRNRNHHNQTQPTQQQSTQSHRPQTPQTAKQPEPCKYASKKLASTSPTTRNRSQINGNRNSNKSYDTIMSSVEKQQNHQSQQHRIIKENIIENSIQSTPHTIAERELLHLETIANNPADAVAVSASTTAVKNDKANVRSTTNTTYQMTMSNNSSKNFNGNSSRNYTHAQSGKNTNNHHYDVEHERQDTVNSPYAQTAPERSYSADRWRSTDWSKSIEAKRAFSVERNAGSQNRWGERSNHLNGVAGSNLSNGHDNTNINRARSVPLNYGNCAERSFLIHAPNIVRNGEAHTLGINTENSKDNIDAIDTANKNGHCENYIAYKSESQKDLRCDRDCAVLTCSPVNSVSASASGSGSDSACNASAVDQSALTSPSQLTDASATSSMGQTNGKPEAQSTSVSSTRSSTPREFRESVIPEHSQYDEGQPEKGQPEAVVVPKIICMDYGDADGAAGSSSSNGSPVEKEVFYDFENAPQTKYDGINITPIDDVDDGIEDNYNDNDDDEVFYKQSMATGYQNKWSSQPMVSQVLNSAANMRGNYVKLEDVPEGEEYDQDNDVRNLDNELFSNLYDSPERPLKSSKSSDSNLSTSFPDSGIGDTQASSSSSFAAAAAASTMQFAKHLLLGNDNERLSPSRTTTTTASSVTQEHQHQQQQQQHHHHMQEQRMPFVRDGYSTDCDETLMQYDDLEYTDMSCTNDERLVCIESICLPDVVVESTTGGSSSSSSVGSSTHTSAFGVSDSGGEHIININGATGNSIGNVHFIPIHIEGDNRKANTSSGSGCGQQKRRSIDDSVIGSGGMKSYSQLNGNHQANSTTIEEIIEDVSETADIGKLNGFRIDGAAEKLKRELVEQKSRFNVQLEDAQKNVHNLQGKINEMQTKIEQLEQELSTKAWNVDRLQGELNAAHKEDEYVRKRLKMIEDEKTNLRHKYNENEDEFRQKIEQLEKQYKELEEKYKETHQLASSLQNQLTAAQSEAEEWREEVDRIRSELNEQTRILKSALENSEAERKICEDKWQREFETLRTQNLDREESLMTDCEWQLRHMQKQCKDKIDKFDHERRVAVDKASYMEQELKGYQAEVRSLSGLVSEQEQSIQSLMEQIEVLKSDLQTANENLERQIEAVKKIKYQCDNALYDKERQMIYRIDEVRNEAAVFWENKLYTEMTRLKNELESVYVDERRSALDKLQNEHIEELRALTTRYTANEEELRAELSELQERFDNRNAEFLELRERTDNTLLQTRMHLDRADRDYQNAMFREEERREEMEEKLRKEFEEEKEAMEEKFRERLNQVKEEFAQELQTTTKELSATHQQELTKQKAKLQAEKDEALQELAERHRNKMVAAEEQMKDIELRHQRDLMDLKSTYDEERVTLDKRDISNANEIEQLHRKCRCLTNLFEEMRMRYERRDPRPEDLREIAELRSRCESQERDLYDLTFQLREMQMKMAELQPNEEANSKKIQKPPPKKIPTTCDVIYEENEERESPPPATAEEDEEEMSDVDNEDESRENSKNMDLINEDDSQMITAV